MKFQGLLYRALNPVYAAEPVSGEGAKRFGGRFNAKGQVALYTSLSAAIAIRESHQIGSLQPTLLVSYDATVAKVFDSNNSALLKSFGQSIDQLAAEDWRQQMNTVGQSNSQLFAQQLIDQGYAGLLVQSYAKGALSTDQNLVLWRWACDASNTLRVIDDEQRLSYRLN